MTAGPEIQVILNLASGLRGTFLEGELILGESSGLFGFPTRTPPFTESLDFLVREDLINARGKEVIDLLGKLGFQRYSDTPTFSSRGRPHVAPMLRSRMSTSQLWSAQPTSKCFLIFINPICPNYR